MLGCTCRINLGIQWRRIQCSKFYAQNQHGRLQGLCPTLPIIFSYVPDLLAQHKCKYSRALELLMQHKHLINHVLQGPLPTQISIYIYHQKLAYTQYIKKIIMFICSGVFDPIYQNKISSQHHNQ